MSDIADYLDGTDPEIVAAAAKRLDWQAFLSGQISREHYEKSLEMSSEEIMAERNWHRIRGIL